MDDAGLKSILGYEAKRIVDSQERWSLNTIPLGETVSPQRPELYRPPPFLDKVATAEQVRELAELLAAMYRVNEANTGWDTLEAEVYLDLSGATRPLRERLQAWTHDYLVRRVDAGRDNPRDRGEPLLRFERLVVEFDDIFSRLMLLPNSLNYLFLEWAVLYARWLLFEKTWRAHVLVAGDRVYLNYRTSDPNIHHRCSDYLRQHGWFDSLFAEALVAAGVRVSDPAGREHAALRGRLAAAVSDIQEMRPFLVRNFRTEKTAVPFGDRLLHWQWTTRYGIGQVFLADDERDIMRFARTGCAGHVATVDLDGVLRDIHCPWVGLPERIGQGQAASLPLNVHVVELMRDRLFSFYEQIDLSRVRTANPAVNWSDATAEQALASSCQALAQSEPDADGGAETGPPTPRPARLRSLRQRQLLNVLRRCFGCEVRQGKGSEITVYRTGAKKFTLGGHRQNPAVPSFLIKLLLQRLGITPQQWFTSLD